MVILIFLQARCERVLMSIKSDKVPALHPDFIGKVVAIDTLLEADNVEEADRQFQLFVEHYGTHFSTSTYLGSG